MAVINQYERRVLPQGGIADVQSNGSQILGQSLQQLGQAGGGLAFDLARIEKQQQQKDDAAFIGEKKPQAVIDLNSKLDALNKPKNEDGTDNPDYVDPTSPDYEQKIGKTVDDYMAEAVKAAPSADSQAELRNYLTTLKAGYLEAGGKYADQSRYAKRLAQVDESNRKWGAVIVAQPSQFDAAVQAQEQLIRTQITDPLKADEQVRKMKSGMAGYAMNGQASANPQAFLKDMGKWGEQGAEPSDIAQAQGIAEAEIKRRQAEAKAEAQRAQQQLQVSTAALAEDAISSAQVNGGVVPLVDGKPIVTEQKIRAAFANDPVRAQRYVDKLKQSQFIGQAKAKIATQTAAEDEALKASVAPGTGGVFTEDDATVQNAVNAAIKAKQSALADEIKQDITDSQNEAVTAINASRADWLQTASVTGAVPDEARTAVAESGSTEAKVFLDKLEQTAKLGQAAIQIKEQPASADRTLADRLGLDLESTGSGSGARAAEADATLKALAEKQKTIAEDPGGFFASANPGVKSGWAAVDASPSDPAIAENTVAMSVQAQLDYGLSPDQVRPLPNARATLYAQTIMTAPPDQAMATIDYVRSISGETGLRQVLGQKGVPNMAKFLAFADTPAQEPVRAAALESMKIKPEELDKLVKDRGYKEKDIDEQVTASIMPLLNTLPPGSVGDFHDALTQITKLYVAKGMTPAKAADEAWSAFDQAYAFHGTFRVPRAFDDQKVQNGVNAVMQSLSKFPIVPQDGAPAGAPADYALNQTIRQLQSGGGRWVTNADDTGLVLTYDVDQNGIPGPAVKTRAPLPSAPIVTEMKLTPQEQFLYQWHVNNITGQNGGKSFKQPNGATSTVLQMIEPVNGKWYSIPSVWDGKPHTEDEAWNHAEKIGWDKFPSYATQEEGQARYDQMHAYMERDIGAPTTGRLEVLFSDLEAGKYGFAVAPDRPGVKMRPGIGGQ